MEANIHIKLIHNQIPTLTTQHFASNIHHHTLNLYLQTLNKICTHNHHIPKQTYNIHNSLHSQSHLHTNKLTWLLTLSPSLVSLATYVYYMFNFKYYLILINSKFLLRIFLLDIKIIFQLNLNKIKD